MHSAPTICVAGSINMDLVLLTPRMPGLGETITGSQFLQIAGGKGANQAVAAARQGAAVTLIGCVGADDFGTMSLKGLQTDGIDTALIAVIPECATGVAGIFVDDLGHNSIVIAPGANARLSVAQIQAAQATICAARLLICQCETPIESVQAAIALAFAHGVKVVFNPAPACALPQGLLAQVDYLIVNETEAGQLSGITVGDLTSAQQASEILVARGSRCVLLTLGAQGVCLAQHHYFHHLPGIPVQVRDTTAAGDTFVGAFATAIAAGLDMMAAAIEAQFCAALTCTRLGAQSSIPQRSEVEQFKTRLHQGNLS